jgi:hypothetical protein
MRFPHVVSPQVRGKLARKSDFPGKQKGAHKSAFFAFLWSI